VEWDWVPLVHWPLIGLEYQWWIWWSENGQQTEVFWENLPQCHFMHHKSHMTWIWIKPRPLLWGVGDWPLSYGMALYLQNIGACLPHCMLSWPWGPQYNMWRVFQFSFTLASKLSPISMIRVNTNLCQVMSCQIVGLIHVWLENWFWNSKKILSGLESLLIQAPKLDVMPEKRWTTLMHIFTWSFLVWGLHYIMQQPHFSDERLYEL
jgi:hypothetical protein